MLPDNFLSIFDATLLKNHESWKSHLKSICLFKDPLLNSHKNMLNSLPDILPLLHHLIYFLNLFTQPLNCRAAICLPFFDLLKVSCLLLLLCLWGLCSPRKWVLQQPFCGCPSSTVHTAVKTKNSRINSVFALIALIELVRQVLWVANGVMRQKNAFLQKLNLEKR